MENETTEENLDLKEQLDESAESENKSSISADLIRGHINTIILRSLYGADKYGYEIMTEIEQKSHGQYTLKQPTLYSALKRLEGQGYIRAYWKTDEVSNGGRRKYFSLTESGKEVTEKNLAEWEYSRTIIDNLISDKSFDFSNPAPTPVDFKILKQSVSRIPSSKPDGEAVEEIAEEKEKPKQTVTVVVEENVAEQKISEEQLREEEARRQTHENFLKLISTPVRNTQERKDENIVPHSDEIDTNKLIYNNKPETERDYKNLIDAIFKNTIRGNSQPEHIKGRARQQENVYSDSDYMGGEIYEKSKNDGLKISASSPYESENNYAKHTTYDKGFTLLKCALAVFGVLLIEFILSTVFLESLGVNFAYPLILLLLGLIPLAICGALAIRGYGKNSSKPTTHSYLTVCVIISVIALLIISVTAFLLNVNITAAGDIMVKLIIPCITALNIPLFGLLFYLQVK